MGAAARARAGPRFHAELQDLKIGTAHFFLRVLRLGVAGWGGRSLDVADLDGAVLLAAALDVRDEHDQIALRNQGPPLEQL